MTIGCRNKFYPGDQIKIYGPTKHTGRTATILKEGKRKLTVQFHDKASGRFVDHRWACHIDVLARGTTPLINDATLSMSNDDATTSEEDTFKERKHIIALSAVLEQLAITTATAIDGYAPGQRRQLYKAFVQSLDEHLGERKYQIDRI